MLKQVWLIGLIAPGLLLAACQPAETTMNGNDGAITAVATIGMLGDAIENVGGDRVTVTTMMGPGVDPHRYTATERDVETLLEADMVFYLGLNLEARMADVLKQLGEGGDVAVVALGERIPGDLVLVEAGVTPSTPDPHLWMDAGRWARVVEAIREVLVAYDPAGEAVYRANAEAYLAELAVLDTFVRESIGSIPEGQRRLVTAHDAFQYYSDAYDIAVFAPQGISTEAEASVADIQATVNYVVVNKVPAVFFESAIPADTVRAIIEGVRAQGVTVTIGGELFTDAMGDVGTPEGTYIGMMRHNTVTIVTALGGTINE